MDLFLKLHLITIIPVLVLGPFILLRAKGDRTHILVGRSWAFLMVLSCLLTFGITRNGQWTWLHGLSIYTLYQMFRAIKAIRRKDLRIHKRAMVGSYIGVLIAFIFASAAPDRFIGAYLRSLLN